MDSLPIGSFTNLSQLMVTGYSIAYMFAFSLILQVSIRTVGDPTNQFWETKTRPEPAVYSEKTFGSHGYIQSEDIKIHYVENGNRNNPLLLLVHGYPEFWYSWRHQLTEFSKDYWVVAMDMRGFGNSDRPTEIEKYKADILANDIKNVITALGRQKCTLVGHDWGGIIVWYFVLNYSNYIDSYIIMNSVHPHVLRTHLNTNLAQIKRSWYMFFYQMPYLPELRATLDDMAYLNTVFSSAKTPNPITPEDLEVYKYNYGRPGAWSTALNIYRANLAFETSDRLLGRGSDKSFPHGLILFGDNDKVLDLVQEDSAKMAANTHLVYIPGASHFVQQDDYVTTNNEMRKFLKDQQHETQSVTEVGPSEVEQSTKRQRT